MLSTLTDCLQTLVIANRILANEGVVDAFGHVSVRHPDNPERFLLSRSRAPELITAAETEICTARQSSPLAVDRAWEYWCIRAGYGSA